MIVAPSLFDFHGCRGSAWYSGLDHVRLVVTVRNNNHTEHGGLALRLVRRVPCALP